jgi:hypothetical protein
LQISVLAGIFNLLVLFSVGFDPATAGTILSSTKFGNEWSAALHAGFSNFHVRDRLLFNGDFQCLIWVVVTQS